MNITKGILELPAYVRHEGVEYVFRLFINHEEVRLVYEIYDVSPTSKHYQTYSDFGGVINENGGMKGFLFLIEGIETDEDLLEGINELKNKIDNLKNI
jgi:hypothetical protein